MVRTQCLVHYHLGITVSVPVHYLFRITLPTPDWLLLKIERCLERLRKSSMSCCFGAFGFVRWKALAKVFSSGAESKSKTSDKSCSSVSGDAEEKECQKTIMYSCYAREPIIQQGFFSFKLEMIPRIELGTFHGATSFVLLFKLSIQ